MMSLGILHMEINWKRSVSLIIDTSRPILWNGED
jgi:hypothetical protein